MSSMVEKLTALLPKAVALESCCWNRYLRTVSSSYDLASSPPQYSRQSPMDLISFSTITGQSPSKLFVYTRLAIAV